LPFQRERPALPSIDVEVIGVRHRANRCKACALHEALLTRIETQDRHALVTTDQLGVGACRTGDLTALAGFISTLWTIVPTGMN
jgi:hypothetical protein